MKRSGNPLLASIQDLILEKYDLESWPTDGYSDTTFGQQWPSAEGDWVDVHVFRSESYIFSIGVIDSSLVVYRSGIYRAGMKASGNLDLKIDVSLFDEDFLEKLWEYIDSLLMHITHSEID